MHISWPLLHKLESLHQDSFYLLDLALFEENYGEFLEAFRAIYPNSNIAYSYKTNYTPRLCQSVNRLGGYAEVVSSMEYDLARRVGVEPQRIIFNGPYKRLTDVEEALRLGSIVNLDSFREVAFIETIATRHPDNIMNVGLRCNVELSSEKVSRFGFDIEGEELAAAFAALSHLPNCRIAGFHCHVSTSDKSIESYARRTREILELTAHYFGSNHPRFINVGGGYFGKMSSEFKKQFRGPIPTYQDYAKAIATQLRDTFHGSSGPELILEPGTAIVANTMKFVAKVINMKTVRDRRIALVSGSIHNIKPTLHGKTLPMSVYSSLLNHGTQKTEEAVDIVGYTCMEHDCLYEGYVGSLTEGDYVVFDNVGAYTTVMKPPFIHPFPPIITHNPELQEFEVSKRQEESSDVFSTYVF